MEVTLDVLVVPGGIAKTVNSAKAGGAQGNVKGVSSCTTRTSGMEIWGYIDISAVRSPHQTKISARRTTLTHPIYQRSRPVCLLSPNMSVGNRYLMSPACERRQLS